MRRIKQQSNMASCLLLVFLFFSNSHFISELNHFKTDKQTTYCESSDSTSMLLSVEAEERNEMEGELSQRLYSNGRYRYLKTPITSIDDNIFYLSKHYKQTSTLKYKSHSPPYIIILS